MGRALDNAMLNVGMKDVARGTNTSIKSREHRSKIPCSWSQRLRLPN